MHEIKTKLMKIGSSRGFILPKELYLDQDCPINSEDYKQEYFMRIEGQKITISKE